MKKFLFIAISFIAFQTSNAQTGFKKSDKFVEGTFSYEKTKDVDATYGLAPTIGYFLTDKVAVGVQVETSKTAGGKQFSTGVFGRCYFLNVGKDFKVFSDLVVKNTNPTVGDSFVTTNLGLGVNYFVTKNLALSANLANLAGYNFETESFNVGFNGVENPLNAPKFGVLYKF